MHPHPLPDELISSWMIRLAHTNGFKAHDFYAAAFGRHREIWTRDIDHCAQEWLIEGLARHTGLLPERIRLLTLRSFESIVFERFNETGVTKLLMSLSVFHRTRRNYGQQYCPICLKEDLIPYFRKKWRLAISVICCKHGVILNDRCMTCNQPVVPHRVDMISRNWQPEKLCMAKCAFCGSSLTQYSSLADVRDFEMQCHIEQVLNDGYVQMNGNTPVYSHLYFEGLRVLIAGLVKITAQKVARINFERAPVMYRLAKLRAVQELVVNWPATFLDFCAQAKSPYSAFCPDKVVIPYWLGSVLRQHVFNAIASVSKSEMESIICVAERDSKMSIRNKVRIISGRDTKRFLPPIMSVSDDVADELLASIDQEISGLSDRRRAILLRDKVMFIAARCLNLNSMQLLAYQIRAIEDKDQQHFSFWDRIETLDQVEAMLCWYQLRVRPIFKNSGTSSLFTSSTGHKLNHSAVGARFHRAVYAAGLSRTIQNWMSWVKVFKKMNLCV